ncbi:MAG TPA: hypothetical protein VGD64_03530 [Acidisarcina sp.]
MALTGELQAEISKTNVAVPSDDLAKIVEAIEKLARRAEDRVRKQ